MAKAALPKQSEKLQSTKPVERRLIYDRNEPYNVILQACDDHGCGISSYDVAPLDGGSDLGTIKSFRFFGFRGNIDQAPDSLFCLAHMYIPPYVEEIDSQISIPPSNRFGIELDNVSDEDGFLGLFVLKLFSNKRNSQISCKKRGQFGCPELLQLPTDLSSVQQEGVLGHFTFNGMHFYPFLMIDYTVCYYVCDAGGTYDWNYRPDGTLKPPAEIFPNVAIDAPVSYDPTLGIYLTRAAHLAPDPPAVDKIGRV